MKKLNKYIRIMIKDIQAYLLHVRYMNNDELDSDTTITIALMRFDEWYRANLKDFYNFDSERLYNLKNVYLKRALQCLY